MQMKKECPWGKGWGVQLLCWIVGRALGLRWNFHHLLCKASMGLAFLALRIKAESQRGSRQFHVRRKWLLERLFAHGLAWSLRHFIQPPNQPTLPIPGKKNSSFMDFRACSHMLCWHPLLRTLQCCGRPAGHLPVAWSSPHSHPFNAPAAFVGTMGSLKAPFLIQPVVAILLTPPNARPPGGPSHGRKTPRGPVVVIKGVTKRRGQDEVTSMQEVLPPSPNGENFKNY